MKGKNTGALSYLLVDEEGDIRTVHDQATINDLLLERNAKHFSQADGTPFTIEPLTALFGRFGTNDNSEKLLDGELDISTITTTEAVKTILRNLKELHQAERSQHTSHRRISGRGTKNGVTRHQLLRLDFI